MFSWWYTLIPSFLAVLILNILNSKNVKKIKSFFLIIYCHSMLGWIPTYPGDPQPILFKLRCRHTGTPLPRDLGRERSQPISCLSPGNPNALYKEGLNNKKDGFVSWSERVCVVCLSLTNDLTIYLMSLGHTASLSIVVFIWLACCCRVVLKISSGNGF